MGRDMINGSIRHAVYRLLLLASAFFFGFLNTMGVYYGAWKRPNPNERFTKNPLH